MSQPAPPRAGPSPPQRDKTLGQGPSEAKKSAKRGHRGGTESESSPLCRQARGPTRPHQRGGSGAPQSAEVCCITPPRSLASPPICNHPSTHTCCAARVWSHQSLHVGLTVFHLRYIHTPKYLRTAKVAMLDGVRMSGTPPTRNPEGRTVQGTHRPQKFADPPSSLHASPA